MRRQQAREFDHLQATKVRLAIAWRVNPEDIPDRRAIAALMARFVQQGEELVMWQR